MTEVLLVDDHIREMLLQGKSPDDIKEYACETRGMKSLWDDAMDRLMRGETTVAEVLRVASSD